MIPWKPIWPGVYRAMVRAMVLGYHSDEAKTILRRSMWPGAYKAMVRATALETLQDQEQEMHHF